MFVNYAHRGASAYAPDSTFAAFDLGLAMGANGIETDLQKTKDGQIVLFHNENLDGRCSGSGRLTDYTYAELQEMDFGGWFDAKYAGERIVLFEDFAKKYFPLNLTFTIELKVKGIEKEALETIKKYNGMEKVYVSSFFFEALEAMRRLDGAIRLSWLIKKITPEAIARLKKIGGSQICPQAALTMPEDVTLAQAQGLGVRLWGVTDEELMQKVYPLAPEGMTVNFPDKLQALLKNRREL